MFLHYLLKLEMLIADCTHTTVELLYKETPEFIPPQLWPPNSPAFNPVDNLWEMLQEKVYKTSLLWSYQRCYWWLAAAATT